MSNTKVSDTILRIRALREKLCGHDVPWQEAFEVRDAVVEQLRELHACASRDGAELHVVQAKIVSILEYLHVEIERSEENK